jgi:tetratricopeptide (TPR) repeat protein
VASSPSMSPQLRVGLLLLAAACTRSSREAPARAAPAATRVAPAPAQPSHAPPTQRAVLERVRPRPAPCAADAGVPAALADRAAAELDAGAYDRALACAEEALRAAPRLVAALAARADALAELGRVAEARLAYARALAVDPDDADTLLGAAELHVRRLGGERDALEAALEYAARGARVAARRGDADLAARLEVVAGMAENDLGRSHLALGHLDRAVRARPDDPDAAYERGVALYELCRFPEAERAFERALALAPDDAWATHHLGLVLERRGDPRAEALLAKARAAAPQEFRPELALDVAGFRAEVASAVAALPDRERRALARVPVEVRDLPDLDDLVAVDPPLSPSILGLYRGPPEGEPCGAGEGGRCRSIVFYRKNLLRFARDRSDLDEQVRVTLLHELGHLHGESDDELRARGLE